MKFITTNNVTLNDDEIIKYEMEAATFNCRIALTRWIYCFGNNSNPYDVREENAQASWDELSKYNSYTRPYIR